MRKSTIITLSTVATVLVTSVSFALYSVSKNGKWPASWPKELEPLRTQSRTLKHHVGNIHEIHFTRQEQFESAWPHILKVKSREAPLTLLRSPYTRLGTPIKAGVRILCPSTGELVTFGGVNRRYPPGAEAAIPDKHFLKVGPPWPDYIKSESGTLPEYVAIENVKWKPCDSKEFKGLKGTKAWSMTRARIEIELIVDGDIVDLNRIPLPANTPIIDKRFKERHNKADAGDGQ